MTELSQRNKDRLYAWVARQARLRDPESSIDPFLIENPDHSNVFDVLPALTSLVF